MLHAERRGYSRRGGFQLEVELANCVPVIPREQQFFQLMTCAREHVLNTRRLHKMGHAHGLVVISGTQVLKHLVPGLAKHTYLSIELLNVIAVTHLLDVA